MGLPVCSCAREHNALFLVVLVHLDLLIVRFLSSPMCWRLLITVWFLCLQENLRSVQEKKVEAYEGELRSLREMYGSAKDKLLEELLSLRAQNQQLQEKVGCQVSDSRLLREGPSFDRSKSEEYSVGDCQDSDEGSNGRSSPFSTMPTPLGRTISNMSSNTDKVCTGQGWHHFSRFQDISGRQNETDEIVFSSGAGFRQICRKPVPLGQKDLVRFVCGLFHQYVQDGNGVCYPLGCLGVVVASPSGAADCLWAGRSRPCNDDGQRRGHAAHQAPVRVAA